MIMYMCKKRIAVSNRELYQSSHGRKDLQSYAEFLAGLAAGDRSCLGRNEKPDILIVREKQLSEAEYLRLFRALWQRSREMEGKQAVIIPHTYAAVAEQVGCGFVHLPLPMFREYKEDGRLLGLQAGVSVHSVEEAEAAQALGAAYVTAGHIFATDCKKGVEPRGIGFLNAACAAVSIPVYAIGGIHAGNLPLIWESRAAGACMMSEYMCGQIG